MRQRQDRWLDKRIIFVSGKGGVGKSLVAAAIAKDQADQGRRVLLAEIGETSYYQDFWGLHAVGHEPTPTGRGFDLALWSGETSLREYVLYYLRMERLYKLFFENKVMRALVNVAPGLSEIAILGKITSGIRKVGPPLSYDVIVVDSYATGHALALFHSPKGLMEAVKFGPMGHHSREILAVLGNPQICGYEVVTLLEELPVVETLEFKAQLQAELGIETHVVANKVMPLPASESELKALAHEEPQGLGEFALYLDSIGQRQKAFLRTLANSGSEISQIPLIFSADPDELVRLAAEALRRA